MKNSRLVLFVVFAAILFQACAHKTVPRRHLISIPENVPIKILKKDMKSAVVMQYSIEGLESKDGGSIRYIFEPERLHQLSGNITNLYFKIELHNPTGKRLYVESVISNGKKEITRINSGGDIRDSIVFLNAPLDRSNEEINMRVLMKLSKDGPPILKTRKLVYIINKDNRRRD